eukprot:scaffold41175_cov72-Phaeocystis_antarctica.AAC.2
MDAVASDCPVVVVRPSHVETLALDETLAALATCTWVRPCVVMCSSSCCTSCAWSAQEAAAGGTAASSRYAETSASISIANRSCAGRLSHIQSLLWHAIPVAETTCFWDMPDAAMYSFSRCTSCARSA